MENQADLQEIMHHLQMIKKSGTDILDNLNSINLLMVDNNNGRVKILRLPKKSKSWKTGFKKHLQL